MTFATICLSTFLTFNVGKAGPRNLEEVVARGAYDRPREVAQFPEVRFFVISDARVRHFTVANHLFSINTRFKKFGSLLQG